MYSTTAALEKAPKTIDWDAHHALARKAAAESIVLLKNRGGLLPLDPKANIAVIGDFAEKPRYQGAGSSLVNAPRVDSFRQVFEASGLKNAGFAKGFERGGKANPELQAEAVELAKKADLVLLFLGLDEVKESEGLDRSDMKLAKNQIDLLLAIHRVNPRLVVVLSCGSAVETGWASHCQGLVWAGLGGQAGAGAVLDTSFEYSDLHATPTGVSLTVKNTGAMAGDEVVQVYISKPDARIFRPMQELKGFARVHLEAGESKLVSIPLDDKAFRYWNDPAGHWAVEGGSYTVRVGACSEDIRLEATVTVESSGDANPYDGMAMSHYLSGQVQDVPDDEFAALLGHPIPREKISIDRNMTLGEIGHGRSPLGWLIHVIHKHLLVKSLKAGTPDLNLLFNYNMPLRAIAKMTGGMVSMGMVDGLVMELKGFWIIGILRVLFEMVKNGVQNKSMEKRLAEKKENV